VWSGADLPRSFFTGEPQRITSPLYMNARELIVELVRGSSETENLKVTSDALTK
jgi:hypothetical protein